MSAKVVGLMPMPYMDWNDPVISGGWVSNGCWVWWKWTYLSGWEEWVPCYPMLCTFFPGSGLGSELEERTWATHKMNLVKFLHEGTVGPLSISVPELMAAQLTYQTDEMLEKEAMLIKPLMVSTLVAIIWFWSWFVIMWFWLCP